MNIGTLPNPQVQGAGALKRLWWHVHDHVIPHARNHYQPHILHHRSLAAFSVLLLTIKVVSFSAIEFVPTLPVTASAITQEAVLELTNRSRVENNLPPLMYNKTLEKAAQMKADDMLARGYFAHNTPDGKTPWTFFEAVGYAYISAGENLAVHFTDVEPLQDAWMSSPGHRANILNSSFKEMGVGIARGQFEGHDSIFVVEEFGNPQVQVAAAQNTNVEPAPVPAPAPARTFVKPKFAAAAPAETVELVPVPAAPAPIPEEAPSVPEVAQPQALAIYETSVSTEADVLKVQAIASNNVVKMLLVYGPHAQFFRLQADGSWIAQAPLLAVQAADRVAVKAFDLSGAEVAVQLPSVSPSFADRYPTAGSVESASISLFGQKVPIEPLEQKAYLGIIALLLTVLVIAVAVHRHLQHVRLVANTAFVVAFACLMLLF